MVGSLQESILSRFGDAEFDHDFGWDLDGGACGWVTTLTSGAVDFDEFAKTRENKFAVLFNFGVGEFG